MNNDDDLKIIISTELEADEEKSAKRIAAQLPGIAALINQKSVIRVGVEINEQGVRASANQIVADLQKIEAHPVHVEFNLDRDSIGQLQRELADLNINPGITRQVTAELDQMLTRIDRVSHAWSETGTENERLLNLSIRGTDQWGRTVEVVKQFVETVENGELSLEQTGSTLTRITSDFEKQRQSAQRAANERIAYTDSLMRKLFDLEARFTGASGNQGLTDAKYLQEAQALYAAINEEIKNMAAGSGELQKSDKSRVENMIASLKLMTSQYHTAETAAKAVQKRDEQRLSFLRKQSDELAKIQSKYTGGSSAQPVLNHEHLADLGAKYQEITKMIDNYRAKRGELTRTEKDGIQSAIKNLELLRQEYRNAEYVGTNLRPRDVNTVNARFTEELRQYEAELKNSGSLTDNFRARIETLRVSLSTAFDRNSLIAYQNGFEQLQADVKSFQAAEKLKHDLNDIDAKMTVMPAKIDALNARFRQLNNPTEQLKHDMSELSGLMDAVGQAKGENEKIAAYEKLQQKIRLCGAQLSALNTSQSAGVREFRLTQNIEKARTELARLSNVWSAFKSDANLNKEFLDLEKGLGKVRTQADFQKWTAQFGAWRSQVRAAGKDVRSLWDQFKGLFSTVSRYLGVTMLLHRSFMIFRNAVQTIIDLDTAMIDLRKTTTMTGKELTEFYWEANEAAKQLGITTKDIIQSAANWSRLGFSDKNSAIEMSKLAAQFSAISPGLDTENATTGLVSVMKAYGIEVNDVLDGVMSKINKIGNTAATSNQQIIEGLKRSASAMAAMNGSLEENIALFTAAQEIVQDEASVGAALRSIALRVRKYNEETEQLDESLTNIVGDVIDLTKTASNPKGVSLFTDETQTRYKTVYQYLKEISEIYDELDAKSRQKLGEKLFGTLRQNTGQAILSNFSAAEKAMADMADSAGSADAEMSIITESLEYRINKLGQTWVGVAQNLITDDSVKIVIDLLTALSQTIEFTTDKLGLLGSVSVLGAAGALVQLAKSAGEPKRTGFCRARVYPGGDTERVKFAA